MIELPKKFADGHLVWSLIFPGHGRVLRVRAGEAAVNPPEAFSLATGGRDALRHPRTHR